MKKMAIYKNGYLDLHVNQISIHGSGLNTFKVFYILMNLYHHLHIISFLELKFERRNSLHIFYHEYLTPSS